MQTSVQDDPIRREVRATLKVNPAATLDTLLRNWRYHRHGIVEEAETAQVETILEEERAALVKRQRTGSEARPWWRLLQRKRVCGDNRAKVLIGAMRQGDRQLPELWRRL